MNNDFNKNVAYNVVKNILNVLFPIITFSYASRVLGPENIGKINFSSSIVSYVTLVAGLGITTYGVRESAKIRENKEALNGFVSQIFSINMISTVIAYILLYIAIQIFSQLYSYSTIIYILSLNVLFTTIGADWINTAFEDFKYITIRTLCCQLLTILLMVIFVKDSEDYLLYAIAMVVAQSGANIINIFYRKKFCTIKLTLRIDYKKHFPPIMLLFSMSLLQTVFVNTDLTILGLFKGDYEIGLYGTAAKITRMVDLAIAAVVWVVLPQLAQKYKEKDYAAMRKVLKYSLNMILDLGIPSVVGMIVISKELLVCFAGNEYLGASKSLIILSIGTLASLLGGYVGNIILLPIGEEKILLKSSMLSALVNLGLNMVLIPSYGQVAAASTTLIAYIVGFLYSLYHVKKEYYIEKIGRLLKAPLLEAIVIIIVSTVFRIIFDNSYIIAVGTIVVSIIAYFFILYIFKDEFFMGYYVPLKEKMKRSMEGEQ